MNEHLRSNLILATALVPGFIIGQLIVPPFGSINWPSCFGMGVGAFTFAIADHIFNRGEQ